MTCTTKKVHVGDLGNKVGSDTISNEACIMGAGIPSQLLSIFFVISWSSL